MLPWIHLDTAAVPGDRTELRLWQRGTEFSIRLGTSELMNSRLSGSEEALATLSLAAIAGRKAPRILIGGLGLGFTLRAALAVAPADAAIEVVELVPAVVAWARGPLAGVFAGCLDEPRVTVTVDDVLAVMRGGRGRYDAVLLDVDNGPEGLTRDSNDAIYAQAGLAAAFGSLRPGGVLAVWSAHQSPAFARKVRSVGFSTEEHQVRAGRTKRGAKHTIWLATRPGKPRSV